MLMVWQGVLTDLTARPISLRANLLLLFFFSYMALLMLVYGDRMEKTWEACHMVEQVGLSYREAKWVVESDLFLDEYPRWDLGSPHQSVILHEMFLTHGIMRMEGGGMYVLPRPPKPSERTQSWRGSICSTLNRVPHILKGAEGCVP